MSTRYRKSKSIGSGIKLNISKNSVGVSAGVKGARVSVNSKGRVTKSVGIPGSGLTHIETSTIAKGKDIDVSTEISENEYTETSISTSQSSIKPEKKRLYLIASILCFICSALFLIGEGYVLGIIFCILGVMGAKNYKTAKKMLKDEITSEDNQPTEPHEEKESISVEELSGEN